ncbi:ArsR/SmtB family transcription factor [Kribbella solani]|uniref:DNA-binding transcriptional ArsR family regulator n=1 Tax=Kribbella solani TaxID=236067 RepID=A0A841DMW6_9ACTN|nr:metalloregulator ArsR/SmtB family transcription factor [Kribbella solani]MBB5980474.1 DNA-binding transcriptional ArsR family regulator [Kribbella solani]
MAEDQVDRFFEVLADPTRRQVVQLLGEGPRRAGQLAAATGASSPAMSRHLKLLLAAGLIADERVPDDARVRLFRLNPEPVVAVQAWLDQVQAHWRDQLTSFQRHVEQRAAGRTAADDSTRGSSDD